VARSQIAASRAQCKLNSNDIELSCMIDQFSIVKLFHFVLPSFEEQLSLILFKQQSEERTISE